MLIIWSHLITSHSAVCKQFATARESGNQAVVLVYCNVSRGMKNTTKEEAVLCCFIKHILWYYWRQISYQIVHITDDCRRVNLAGHEKRDIQDQSVEPQSFTWMIHYWSLSLEWILRRTSLNFCNMSTRCWSLSRENSARKALRRLGGSVWMWTVLRDLSLHHSLIYAIVDGCSKHFRLIAALCSLFRTYVILEYHCNFCTYVKTSWIVTRTVLFSYSLHSFVAVYYWVVPECTAFVVLKL